MRSWTSRPSTSLRELADNLHTLERPRLVIAEDERNEPRLILPVSAGGYGLDAVLADDCITELRRLTAGDHEGYFGRYRGAVEEIVTTLRDGWFREAVGRERRHARTRVPRLADSRPARLFTAFKTMIRWAIVRWESG